MIPHDLITEWGQIAPWTQSYQVEQDLVICRALVDILPNTAIFKPDVSGTKMFPEAKNDKALMVDERVVPRDSSPSLRRNINR